MGQRNPPVKASLFVTCVVDQLYPEVGESTVRTLRRLGVDVSFNPAQTCCGQPAFNSGFWNEAKPLAKRTLDLFANGDDFIVVPSGSCAAMMRVFYDELFSADPTALQQVQVIKPRIFELSEFIVDVLGVDDLSVYASASAGASRLRVTYHEACHLRRELGIRTQPRTLIQSLPGVELVEMEQSEVCCGFGGTFAVKYPEISAAMLDDKLTHTQNSGADAVTACDSSCLMHIGGGLHKQRISVRAVHLAALIDDRLNRAV